MCKACAVHNYLCIAYPGLASMSAPFSRSREQVVVWPADAALCNAVEPYYNNRETGQVRDTQTYCTGDGHGTGAGRVLRSG